VRSDNRMRRGADFLDDEDTSGRGPQLLPTLGWSHRDAVGFVVGTFVTIMILVNMLFLQPGPHPAPIIKSGIGDNAPVTARKVRVVSFTRPQSSSQRLHRDGKGVEKAPATARSNDAIITDIQRELARRGFYDGAVDGRYGPKTDAAIREFEHAAGLKPSEGPSEILLHQIDRSKIKAAAGSPPTPRVRPDPIAALLAPSKRVVAVQRALTEYGYGQINPTGVVDAETQAAIEKFERQRKLPITGQLSDRVARELSAVTGRPLE
jgi:peptidoglycan hydrolase-like protein with peptidoglycan-binding domain